MLHLKAKMFHCWFSCNIFIDICNISDSGINQNQIPLLHSIIRKQCSMKKIFSFCLFLLIVASSSAQTTVGETITLEDLLAEMTSFEEAVYFPAYTCHQESSYDRKSIAPDVPGWVVPAFDLVKFGTLMGKGLCQPHTSYSAVEHEKGGSTFFLPIPYAKNCKITLEEPDHNAASY